MRPTRGHHSAPSNIVNRRINRQIGYSHRATIVAGKGVRRERLSNIFHPIKPKIVIIRNPISTGPFGSKLTISILLSIWIFYRVPSEV